MIIQLPEWKRWRVMPRKRKQDPPDACGRCRWWTGYGLGWGECRIVAEAVPGGGHRSTYEHAPCVMVRRDAGTRFERKERK